MLRLEYCVSSMIKSKLFNEINSFFFLYLNERAKLTCIRQNVVASSTYQTVIDKGGLKFSYDEL